MITPTIKKSLFFTGFLFINSLILFILHISIGHIKEVPTEFKTFEKDLKTNSQQIQTVEKDLRELKTNYDKLNNLLNKEVSFKEGLKFVLAFEGGLSDDEGDTGGLTNLGITHTEYDQYRASKGLPAQSVAKISLKEASDIYKHTYWEDSGCSDLTRRVALSCFDWAVNAGPSRAIQTLQQTLGGIAVDGFIGPETTNELDAWLVKEGGEDHFLHNYFERRENFYRRWGVGSQAKFLQGWLRRAETLKDYLKVP